MNIDKRKTIRITRLILTCLILFLLTWYYQLPEREWSLITVWFVMSEYTGVGGVLKKSFYRFAGTTLSAIYGMVIIYFFDNNVVINIFALIAGVFFYMHYFIEGEKTYIGVIGSVTLTIVLLNHNDLDAALLRTFNIVIGILASMFMIRFFYPRYARDEVLEELVNFTLQLERMLATYLDPNKTLALVQTDAQQIEKNIIGHLAAFDRHLSEARVETVATPLFLVSSKVAVEHIRHLFRLFIVLIQYLASDQLRLDQAINQRLFEVLQQLTYGKEILLQQAVFKPVHPAPHPDATNETLNRSEIEGLINHIDREVFCLNDKIEKVMSIYGVYQNHSTSSTELSA